VDPESLELIPVRSKSIWPTPLGGVGELAVSGEEVSRWFQTFAALRHKHYKHGPRHSEYVCDVKLLLSEPEIRLFVAARLAWYAHKHQIDLVVYPCHSNAYLLAELLRTGWQDDSGAPSFQVALCRTRSDERNYVLPEGGGLRPKRVMILDDAVGGGASFKSLAAEIHRHYGTNVTSLHLVVFCNEFPVYQRIFWSRMAAKEKDSSYKPLLFGRMHFTSFISLPAPSYPERRCPVCARRDEFRERRDDKNLTVYEHLFYDEWQNDLTIRDLSHHPRQYGGRGAHHQAPDPAHYSRNALEMLAFDEGLRGDASTENLVSTASAKEPVEVMIHCLRMLREHGHDYLDPESVLKTNEALLGLLVSPDLGLDRRQALLVVKALMWHKKPVSAEDFCALVSNGFLWFADPYFLGAVFAYARMGAADQHSCPPWHGDDVVTKCLQNALETAHLLEERHGDANDERDKRLWRIYPGIKAMARGLSREKLALVREGVTLLHCWFQRGGEARSDGALACVLWDACRETYGHTKLPTETTALAQEIGQLDDGKHVDAGSRKRVTERARTVCRLLRNILDAVPVAAERSRAPCSQDDVRRAEDRLHDLDKATQQLADATGLQVLHDALSTVHQCIGYFDDKWTGIGGNLSKLLRPFETPLRATLDNALRSVNAEIASRSETVRTGQSVLTLCAIEDDLDAVVFTPPDLIQKAFHNALANIWKYQVCRVQASAEGAALHADVHVELRRETDAIQSPRISIHLWCEGVPWHTRPSDLFPVGHGNHELRALLAEYRGQYNVDCDEAKQCVVTRVALLDVTTQGRTGLTETTLEPPR